MLLPRIQYLRYVFFRAHGTVSCSRKENIDTTVRGCLYMGVRWIQDSSDEVCIVSFGALKSDPNNDTCIFEPLRALPLAPPAPSRPFSTSL